MTGAPWTFDEALSRCQRTSVAQQHAEGAMRAAARDFAVAEEAYRIALAKEIVRQHAEEGVAWTVAPDLARGDKTVAKLRRERDIAEGVREAVTQAAWRASADRKDAQRFADYSLRRDLQESGGGGDTTGLAWAHQREQAA
jgi:hypothetical protein